MITEKDFKDAIDKFGDKQYSQFGMSLRNEHQVTKECFALAEQMTEEKAQAFADFIAQGWHLKSTSPPQWWQMQGADKYCTTSELYQLFLKNG